MGQPVAESRGRGPLVVEFTESAGQPPSARFHAATEAMSKLLSDAYREFVDAYRRAAEKLQAGNRDAPFP